MMPPSTASPNAAAPEAVDAAIGAVAIPGASLPTAERASPVAGVGSRIASLDGLRAISILLVVLGHARHGIANPAPGWETWVSTIVGNQSLGVSTFFVLSGFLITTLLLREEAEHGKISLPGFYLRRAFRILPAFYAYILAIWLLDRVFGLGITRLHFLSALTFTWNYVPGTEGWWLGHSWSLCVEEQFYLLWPLVLSVLGRKRATWFASTLILLLPFVRLASYALLPAWRGRIPVMLHTRIDILMFGCLLALLPWDGSIMNRLKTLVARRGVQIGFLVYLFAVSPLLTEYFRGKYLLPIGFSLDGLCIALLLLWTVNTPHSVIGRILNLRWVARLGVLSYSLYLWQQLFTPPAPSVLSTWLPFNLLAAYVMAEISYRFIEQPFLRLRKKVAGA